jgi:acyl-CoA thioesterase
MQKNGVDHVISNMCMLLRRAIFNAQGRFFDKNGTLVASTMQL